MKEHVAYATEQAATSVKEELTASMPNIQDAADYRQARMLLMDKLGGIDILLRELVFSGYVHPSTFRLTTNERPNNVFARIVAGKLQQPGMDEEQEALGEYQKRFMICRNLPDNDAYWDSADANWLGRASMSIRHRFLTTKSLHFQWFNLLIAGLVHTSLGGVSMSEALKEVEAMRTAALYYARNIGGWSSNIGLFVNIFGHNSVNSLFVHILDMSETGPSFQAQSYKNLSLDDVIKVLAEDVASHVQAKPLGSDPLMQPRHTITTGTNGATSLKEEIVAQVPNLKDPSAYREVRRKLREEFGGVEALREELCRTGFVDRKTDHLTTGTKPFNVFARVASGVMSQPNFDEEQKGLGEYAKRFCICSNLPDNDLHWDSEDPQWVGKASMARRHKFLTTKNLHWSWFNSLVFGMFDLDDDSPCKNDIRRAITELQDMKAAALAYTSAKGWSPNIGLFFHVFGHNSVNSLHMHILDLVETGPTFSKYEYKNCPVDVILKVLSEEKSSQAIPYYDALFDVAKTASEAVKVTTAILRLTHGRNQMIPPEETGILEINVGGVPMTISIATAKSMPMGSSLRETLLSMWDSTTNMPRDSLGRVYLDFPSESFTQILDHVRLLQMMPKTIEFKRSYLSYVENLEVLTLADSLGVNGLFNEVQRGHMEVAPQQSQMVALNDPGKTMLETVAAIPKAKPNNWCCASCGEYHV